MMLSASMENVLEFYRRWYNTIWYYFEILYACILLFCHMDLKKHWKVRVPGAAVIFTAVGLLMDGFLQEMLPGTAWAFNYVFCVMLVSACVKATHSCVFCYVGVAFSLQNFCSSFEKLIFMTIDKDRFMRVPLFFICTICLLTVFYIVVLRRFSSNYNFRMEADQIVILFFLMIVISSMDDLLAKDTFRSAFSAGVIQCGTNVMIIVYLLYLARKRTLERLKKQLERYIDMDTQRYEQMKQDMKILDMKYHDFKQYIHSCEEMAMINKDTSEEMLAALEDINKVSCCGNHALDLVLTDKIYLCRRRKIRFAYTIDSSGLEKIKDEDIVSLFNNILYNAIEYLSQLEDPDKRIITLKVINKNGFLIIHCENYCETDLVIKDDLPQTTKKNKEEHGLGMRSIQYIVKKYEGELKINNRDQQFSINIIIPI